MEMSQDFTVELKERQYKFLSQMAEKHDLADESKALRCLINFAMEESAQESAIFDEIRCLDCG